MIHIDIATIPHKEHRYSTTGDFYLANDIEMVKVSDMQNDKYEFLVALHELIEMNLCKAHGVEWNEVDKFDIEHPELDEPGDSEEAPYHKEHMFASKIERMMADEMGINWEEYNKVMDNLYNGLNTTT